MSNYGKFRCKTFKNWCVILIDIHIANKDGYIYICIYIMQMLG